jgi:hypothetical protein
MFAFPVIPFLFIAGFGRKAAGNSRLVAWTVFAMFALPMLILPWMFLARGYSGDAYVRVTEAQLEIRDVVRGRTIHEILPWADISEIQVRPHTSDTVRCHTKDGDAGRADLEIEHDGRTSTALLVIISTDGHVVVTDALEGFDRMVRELIDQAGLKTAPDIHRPKGKP